MFLPIEQDNFPQKQSTLGKKNKKERKEIPNIIWGQNKNKWVAMKFFLRKMFLTSDLCHIQLS